MLDNFRKSKKNLKIQNWKLGFSGYRFDIEYRPGQLNLAADALTRDFNAKKNVSYVNSLTIQRVRISPEKLSFATFFLVI